MLENRIILGETQQAGLPISAPIHGQGVFGIRWVKRDGYFALQVNASHKDGPDGSWIDVPCVPEPDSSNAVLHTPEKFVKSTGPGGQPPPLDASKLHAPCLNLHDFHKDLQALINRYSVENLSDTPDFILANFVVGVLNAFANAINGRDEWYKHDTMSVKRSDKTDAIP